MSEQNHELTIIDKSIDIFKGGAAVLVNHKNIREKAIQVGNDIIREWEAAQKIEDPDAKHQALAKVDERSNKFLANCSNRVKSMKDDRSPISQLMSTILKMYTEEENQLDIKTGVIPQRVQQFRNNYAKWRQEEDKRREQEAEKKRLKAEEAADIRARIKAAISQHLISLISNKKASVITTFNNITLETIDAKSVGLKGLITNFPSDKLGSIPIQTPVAYHHTATEVEIMKGSVLGEYDFSSFYSEYQTEMEDLKRDLWDKLPSKRQELEEAERKRIADEQAEKERQEAIERSKGEERERLKKQAEEQRKRDEEQRKRDEEARQQREAAEKERLAQEAEKKQADAQKKIEVEQSAEKAQALFDQSMEISSTTAAPEVRKGFDIVVLMPAGWVEMFTYWYQNAGVTMNLGDIGKMTFTKIKTFCEKEAKEGRKIESKFLRYDDEVKAVNKRAKTA